MNTNARRHTLFIIGIVYSIFLSCNGFAGLIIDNTPTTIIRDSFSKLDRPEGVSFTPSGKYIAVVNSLIDSITFYKRIGDDGSHYENAPSFSIEGGESQLHYPHDLAFSPDGLHLAVANRETSAITIYEKNQIYDSYDIRPIAVIQGAVSGVLNPDTVRYSPANNILAVANLGNNSITFYYYNGNIYAQIPYQTIHNPPDILSVPDSLDFSVDGELLATTSHNSHAVVIYQRISETDGLYTSWPVEIIRGPETNFCYPHSVSFHPTKNYLCVSSSQGRKNVNIFQKNSDEFPRYGSKPVLSLEVTQMYDETTIHLLEQLHQEGGCKGVAFSPDGTSLAVTQNLCADQLMVPYPVGVLLIYSVMVNE